MADIGTGAPGTTFLPADQLEGLIPDHIVTQGELNEWEQANISSGHQWAFARRRKIAALLSDAFVRKLHKEMLGKTWRWAGQYRLFDTNIGIDWMQIPVAVRQLCDDVAYQREHEVLPIDELVVRMHHRLVSIHPFPNGNGRHARLYSDLVLVSFGQPAFTWGSGDLQSEESAVRGNYLKALKAADNGDFGPLLRFVRS